MEHLRSVGNPVLLPKDQTLGQLHAEIVGRLYKPFDTQDPESSIPALVAKWLRDKGLIA